MGMLVRRPSIMSLLSASPRHVTTPTTTSHSFLVIVVDVVGIKTPRRRGKKIGGEEIGGKKDLVVVTERESQH